MTNSAHICLWLPFVFTYVCMCLFPLELKKMHILKMVRMLDLSDQILVFSLKTLREEKRSISAKGTKLYLRCTKLYLTLDLIRVESDINSEVRTIMSATIANKHRNIMYTVEPVLCFFVFFSYFYLPVTKAGVRFTKSSHY